MFLEYRFNTCNSPKLHDGTFLNNKNQTKNLCNFRFVPRILKSDMVELTSTSILLYNVKSLKIDCQDYKKTTNGCKFCIYDLSCKCSLLSENLVFTPKLVDCQKHEKCVYFISSQFSSTSRILQWVKIDVNLGDTLYPNPIESIVP